jgi:hypothetical protein
MANQKRNMKVVEKQLASPRDQRANASRMNEFNLNMLKMTESNKTTGSGVKHHKHNITYSIPKHC